LRNAFHFLATKTKNTPGPLGPDTAEPGHEIDFNYYWTVEKFIVGAFGRGSAGRKIGAQPKAPRTKNWLSPTRKRRPIRSRSIFTSIIQCWIYNVQNSFLDSNRRFQLAQWDQGRGCRRRKHRSQGLAVSHKKNLTSKLPINAAAPQSGVGKMQNCLNRKRAASSHRWAAKLGRAGAKIQPDQENPLKASQPGAPVEI
jgi:hypothetical protein